jgi:hypothetical protein
MTKTTAAFAIIPVVILFGSFEFCDSNLPFDLAQGGEPVEPFRFSNFDIRI